MKYRYFLYFLTVITLLYLFSCTRRRHGEMNDNNRRTKTEQRDGSRSYRGKVVIRMEQQNGVYYVPCKINGSEMQFIFDTGASDITMSLTEALFLYKQGKLTNDDFIGTQEYQIADGSVSEGTIVNLRSVTIGDRSLNNVQASIVHNLGAPLLLGQSALSKFGRISIDYKKHEIVFE